MAGVGLSDGLLSFSGQSDSRTGISIVESSLSEAKITDVVDGVDEKCCEPLRGLYFMWGAKLGQKEGLFVGCEGV